MKPERFRAVTGRYASLRLAILGDFCLDRYLEIDPARTETSIETGLPVHNVVRTRGQPGAAGTILNNLVALGVGEIHAIGFCGEDGEGYELLRALRARRGVVLDSFVQTSERRTFTYTKPLLMHPGRAPEELSRLDCKNWTETPETVSRALEQALATIWDRVDGVILMDQVDVPNTGVVNERVRHGLSAMVRQRPDRLVLADSRRGLVGYPPVHLKMNGVELGRLLGQTPEKAPAAVARCAQALAGRHGRPVFVSLAEQGIVGATPTGEVEMVAAFPVSGEIDIVGAGDAVTANLMAGLAAGAGLREALALAMAAASIVIHQLGTTGTATVEQLAERLAVSGREGAR